MDMVNKIDDSLKRAENFLLNKVNTDRPGIKKCSEYHDIVKYPDMCLPATYNATHALILLGAYKNIEESLRSSIAEYICSYQIESGAFRFKNMKNDEIWKGRDLNNTWQYIDFHVTNYCIGALKSLEKPWRYPLNFIQEWTDQENLEKWLEDRDLTDPWMEGNNIVNLASFLICTLEGKEDPKLQKLTDVLFAWHDRHQDPQTGFWGTNHPLKPAGIMQGMAGAAHNFHLYYYYDREIPYYKKIVDYCLQFIKGGVRSACLDIDVVDILANMWIYGYRSDEILESLAEFGQKLISFQNQDGGFADEKSNGVRRMDGWVKGYFEPQGLSNCFATWFRCASLAMISYLLDSEKGSRFKFRNTVGIGYFNKKYLRGNDNEQDA